MITGYTLQPFKSIPKPEWRPTNRWVPARAKSDYGAPFTQAQARSVAAGVGRFSDHGNIVFT